HSKLNTRPNCAEILKIFDEIVQDFNTVYLVIDALDEISETNQRILLKQAEALSGNTRLLVTTRHADNIVNRFRNCPKTEIRATDMDLTKYIFSRIAIENRLECMVRDDPSLENQLCERVTTKADGMFLAAKLHMDALSSKFTLKSLRKALENLPTTLDDLYNEALHRIEAQSPDDQQLAFNALRWVAYTYRPLGFRALQEALAIETGEEDFDSDGLPPISLVIDVCAGLLTADAETGKVRLVHYTTQDYMDSVLASKFPDAHALIARDCLTYLSYKIFQSNHKEHNLRFVLYKYKLFEYASTFWAAHAKSMRTPELYAQMQRYLASDPQVYFIAVAGYEQSIYHKDPLWGRCLGYGIAAFLGLSDELTHSLQYVVDIDQLIHIGRSNGGLEVHEAALHLAARNNQVGMVCILLDHGANIERKTLQGVTPLFLATKFKALATAEVLIQRGANVMATGSQWGQLLLPFQAVWWSSPVQFLQHLLDAGTEIKRQHLFEVSPLMRSIIRYSEPQTHQWLFSTALKDFDRTPIQSKMLHLAASEGANYIVDTLLNFGADVNSKDGSDNTALHNACRSGHPAIVERLLECGANVNKRNIFGETALHQAVRYDQVEIVELLIAYHSDINVQTCYGVTPLMEAIHRGCTSTALSLLQHGAITGFADFNGITTLHLASARGNTSLVIGLMDQNESVEKKSNLNLAAIFPAEKRSRQRYTAPIGLLDVEDVHGYYIAVFSVHESKALSELRKEGFFPGLERCCLEWRVWEQGMTAFDIALLRDDKQTMDVLSYGGKREDQSYTKTRDEYFREGFAALSFQELMTEFERRRSEDYWLQEGCLLQSNQTESDGLSESTITKKNLTMSQANQFSIDTINGGTTDLSALSDPSDHESSHDHVPSAMTLSIQNVASTPNETQANHTKLEHKPNNLFMGNTFTTATDQVQRQPLFQSFGRHSPTQAELENAEEIDYEDLPQVGHGAKQQVGMSDTHPSALVPPIGSIDHEAAIRTASPFTRGEIDREEAVRTSARFNDQCNTMTNHALCAHAADFSCSQSDRLTETYGGEGWDGMVTDEETETLGQETGGDMTEQEMWEIFNDGEVDEGGDEDDDKENLAPFNGLVRWRSE
ncbi:MAG: hypothetical protein Q9192_006886, partial [Flavoplaca navasiana]